MSDQPAETPAAPAATETAPAEESAAAAPAVEEGKAEEKPAATEEKKPEDPEAAAKRKAERAERRKEQRKAARQKIKEAKANGEAPKPKAEKQTKAEVVAPEGAAPKITVAKIPVNISVPDFKALFEKYGTVLRAEVSKRKNRPTIGTIYFNTHGEVRRAVQALHGKHKVSGEDEPISIQYGKDAVEWGTFVKDATDSVAELLRQYEYKPSLLRSKDAKDLINRLLFTRKKSPSNELLTAALLVHLKVATPQELVDSKLISSVSQVQQLLQEEKSKAPAKAEPVSAKAAAKGKREDAKPAVTLERTFDAVVPKLDKLEKERWNRMAKANLRLSERQRFRFVDILATPSLELWRWMVEDCEVTPAEAGTCFSILQNYYGFTK